MKKLLIYFFILSGLFLYPGLSRAAEPAAEEILLKSDEVRNPQLDYTVYVKITSYKAKRAPLSATYDVMIKGKDKTVIKTLSPPIDRGRTMLMLNRDLWIYLPELSKPLRISLRERLIGDVANGDIARANFTGDYTPEIIKTEQIDGKDYYVLGLLANADNVTYSRALLWVEKDNYYPLKAEFYAASGRMLKTCSYENYKELAGRLRPSRLVMTDPIIKGQNSIIEYDNMDVRPLEEKYFTKDYMKKFMD